MAAGILSACGGGGGGGDDGQAGGGNAPGGSTPGGSTPPPASAAPLPSAVASTASMVMSCPDGAGFQCSGSSLIRQENGIALTSSGVQAYGRSTSDLASPIADATAAFGFAPASGGLAEIRVAKNATSAVTQVALLLSNLGLSWDGDNDRPLIIETFNPTAGRTTLTSTGALQSATLPPETDLAFFDYASRRVNGTQANYANNRYFPRTNPSRCPAGTPPGTCATTETTGLQPSPGDWRTGGTTPDIVSAIRVHGDGDVHAGNGPATSSGTPTYITGGTGPGVPFPGSKGYRGMDNWGLQYANLGAWVTQDTVLIEEWAALGNEHNKNRRGMVAYGQVTEPAAVPSTGTASYTGIAYGWYAPNATVDPTPFRGAATVTVDFATRQATIAVQNAVTYDAAGAAVPVNFSTVAGFGANGSNVANYMTGTLTAGSLSGGIGGRLFGPVAGGGAGTGPAEAAGTFTLSGGGVTAIGGFLARKQ
ncbi:MAG TPA: hypothetical protein VIM12_01390 [Noviherbaspirillum sp.]|uniref:hypothetical protein n=1 Tax=Noviherbaspirillum sp. TaxID=1926288 RepID=UPI002F939CA3